MAKQKLYDTTMIKEALMRIGWTQRKLASVIIHIIYEADFKDAYYGHHRTYYPIRESLQQKISGRSKMSDEEIQACAKALDLNIDDIRKIFEKRTRTPEPRKIKPKPIDSVEVRITEEDLDNMFNGKYPKGKVGQDITYTGMVTYSLKEIIYFTECYPSNPLVEMYICKMYNLKWDEYVSAKLDNRFDDNQMIKYLAKHNGELPDYSK